MRGTDRQRGRRGGFTLVEILVTLLLIGLLVGVVLPSVIGQAEKGEVQRVVDDLEAVRSATKVFRLDVNRWPGALEDLVSQISTGDTYLGGGNYNTGQVNKWAGPYLEIGSIPAGGLTTALSGVFRSAFGQSTWGGSTFLTVYVDNIESDQAQTISELVDGDTDVTSGADSGGRVRWAAGSPNYLIYLATPIN